MNDFLSKPVSIAALRQAIERARGHSTGTTNEMRAAS
jgi:hypothetical protein